MDYAAARVYLLDRPEATEDFPFGPDVRVFRVCHKMFALLAEKDGIARVNLKCDPEKAQALLTLGTYRQLVGIHPKWPPV